MNKLILKEYNSDYLIYWYQPEGRGEFGEILFTFSNNNAKITKEAEGNDTWHANKALFKVCECVEKKNLPLEFIQAWY
ncbi:MAG: hypothetical protein FWC47_06385 [Oscillospiraceae bacterium]|nr:hypothetical protein [Oscillospiraceae bacterium]